LGRWQPVDLSGSELLNSRRKFVRVLAAGDCAREFPQEQGVSAGASG
jgi:hypothetical protein